ncbi:MAG: hypothetical protein ABW318_20950 [Vicinamibacterales bacterium]|jgi:hypothetical protein
MQPISKTPTFLRLLADVDERLRALRAQSKGAEDEVAEINAIQRVLAMLTNVETDAQLVDAYDEARGLMMPADKIETARTEGENRAGVWLKQRIESALDALGVENPPGPTASASPKRKAQP